MATLVLDIETVGVDWHVLDFATQHSLTRWIHKSTLTEQEKEQQLAHIKSGLGLSPFTGTIVAIGLYDVERRQGVVYFKSDDDTEEIDYGDFVLRPRTEKEMLVDFWDGARSYDTFVTFNGRRFDMPFLSIRTAIHGMRPSVIFPEQKYVTSQKNIRHVDLQDQLTFHNALQKRPSLHVCCQAFGIQSAKEGRISGEHIAELFHAKKFRDIAKYNAVDVASTHALYEKWYTHLAPVSFKESIDF